MKKKLYIKVCGNSKEENILAVKNTEPDLMGFIFPKDTPRHPLLRELRDTIHEIPERTRKVGVFENEPILNLKKLVILCDLHLAQLNGGEDVEYCQELIQKSDFGVIKVFNVNDDFDFDSTKEFEDIVHFFLFDTKSDTPSGSGKKFNWGKLKEYTGELSFFLAGGIGPDDAEDIKNLKHDKFIGISVNSSFNTEPGIKDVEKVNAFIKELRK